MQRLIFGATWLYYFISAFCEFLVCESLFSRRTFWCQNKVARMCRCPQQIPPFAKCTLQMFLFLDVFFFIFRDIFHILLVSFHVTGMCRCSPPSAKMHLTKFFLLKLFDFFVHIFMIFFTLSWHLLCDKDVKIPPAAEMDLANCLLLWIFCHLKIQCFFL